MLSNQEEQPVIRPPRPKLHKVKAFFAGLCVLLVLGGLYYLAHRPWLAFGTIRVEEAKLITVEDVKKVGNIQEPVNLFNISCSKLENVLNHDARIEKAVIKYGWPNVLRVIVTERKPAVYVACSYDGIAKVDYAGHVLEVGKGIRDATAPFVSGWQAGNIYTGDIVDSPELLGLLSFLGKLDKAVTDEIAEIAMDKDGRIKVFLNSGVPVILGPYQDAPDKADKFIAICNELKTKKVKAQYIDLTYNKPYIKL